MTLTKMSKGTVTFSFDCEGKWGMADIPTDWDVSLNQDNLFTAYEFILETLKENDICATFAFVGALTERRDFFLEEISPKLTDDAYYDWLDYSKHRILDKEEEGWFMPELLTMVKAYKAHEIATHGYTHIPFNMLDIETAKKELELISRWAERNEIECSTMIFPRNIIRHYDLLREYGILGFRDIPSNISTDRIPRFLKTLINEMSVLKKSQQIQESEPIRIPGGTFINWRHGFRRYIPSLISLSKYKSMINHSINNNGVAHFWIHPHNFITSPLTKDLFRKLCEEVSEKRNNLKLEVKKQNDFLQ